MPEEVQGQVAEQVVNQEGTVTDGATQATGVQEEIKSLDAAIRQNAQQATGESKDDKTEAEAPAAPADKDATPKPRVSAAEKRIIAAEDRATAAEKQLQDLQKQITQLQTARERQEATERAELLEGQLAELNLELEKAQAQAKGLVSPEEARARANAAAAEARRKAEAKASEAEAALAAQETEKSTALQTMQERLAEVERELAERQEQIETQKRVARETAAISALQTAGLRADSIPYAKLLMGDLLAEDTNLDDDADRVKFITAFKEQHRVFFGNPGTVQASAGVAVQPVTTPATGSSMNAFIREVSGRVG